MAQEIRRIGNSTGLLFELDLKANAKHDKGLAWGKLLLSLAGETIWAGENAQGEDVPLSWTWIDLLEFLGKWWPWITLEEDYPIPVSPTFPHLLRTEAEQRWEDLDDERVSKEEEAVYRFLCRHDMAMALKGLYVPSLVLLRQGDEFLISSAASKSTVVRPLDEVVNTLESLGDHLANFASGTGNARGKGAINLWQNRTDRLREQALTLRTGLTPDERASIQGENPETDFWGFDPENPMKDSEILAAARMGRGLVTHEDQQRILTEIKKADKYATPELDRLTEKLRQEFKEDKKPHDQGYQLAAWLRIELAITPNDPLAPEDLLRKWKVEIRHIDLPDSPVEAIAAWGEQHGPVILLNSAEDTRSAHEFGKHSTLAHEICHLLYDRRGALPVGEVLGGRVSNYAEKRARAFAAELLIPRETASSFFKNRPTPEETVEAIRQQFRVSTEVVAWQILNYLGHTLNHDQESRLKRMTRRTEQTVP